MSLNLQHILDEVNEIVVSCPICLDVIDEKLITLNKCQHTFHQSCISSWFQKSNTCPLCRETILDIYKCIYYKPTCPFYKKKKIVIEFKPNKLVLYKLEIEKKNSIFICNTSSTNLNLDTPSQNQDRNNIVRPQSTELDLTRKNHILQLLPNEKIGCKKFQILYSDISKVSCMKRKIYFDNLKIVKNEKNAKRSENNSDKLKLLFPNNKVSRDFFETLKKRHQYFRDTNY